MDIEKLSRTEKGEASGLRIGKYIMLRIIGVARSEEGEAPVVNDSR